MSPLAKRVYWGDPGSRASNKRSAYLIGYPRHSQNRRSSALLHHMKKLLVVIHSLSGGGAERVVTRLLAYLAQRHPGAELSLALLKPNLDYEVPSGVKLHILGTGQKSLFKKIWDQKRVYTGLKKLIRDSKPDVVLSFMPTANIYSLLVKRALGGAVRVVISERVAFNSNYHGLKKAVLTRLFKAFYPAADGIVCVAEGVKRDLAAIGIDERLCVVIPNSVDSDELSLKSNEREAHEWAMESDKIPLLVNVGRLHKQKGQDVLLCAAAILKEKGIDFRLMVFGTGELEPSLSQLVNKLGLEDRVKLMGFTPNPYPEVSRASVFAFPSRWEGFPNALLEGMTLGVPAVAADCPYGPRDLVGDDEFGVLVPVDDAQALATALAQTLAALKDPAERSRRQNLSRAGAARFSVNRMLDSFERVLQAA